jgi:serine/threonine protein kinase
MGAVYRATDTKFGTRVAIKETFFGDTEIAEAFEREARLLNGLHHAILPHVSDHFIENGGHFLVMEYIEGDDLSALLKRGEVFSVDTVLSWTMELLDGLDYLHSQDPPVIHRDIKPNNLKLTPRGKLILLDFGMAKETAAHTLGEKSVFGYSKKYSPLEQIEGAGTDERSDIFSVGASVYHLLTGEAPVDALARASAIVGGRPDPLPRADSLRSDVPQEIATVVHRALDLNADGRFESARAMTAALEGAMANISDVRDIPSRDSSRVAAASTMSVPIDQPASDPDSFSAGVVGFDKTNPVASEDRSLRRSAIPKPFKWTSSVAAALAVAAILVIAAVAFTLRNSGSVEDSAATPAETSEEVTSTEVAEDKTAVEGDQTPAVGELADQTGSESGGAISPAIDASREASINEKSNSSLNARSTRTRSETQSEDEPQRRVTSRDQTRAAERQGQDRNTRSTRPRRAPEPVFEQPSVSSIEAIMTGVPSEQRRRWQDREIRLTNEEMRRRQLRRMRRENRRQQFPY